MYWTVLTAFLYCCNGLEYHLFEMKRSTMPQRTICKRVYPPTYSLSILWFWVIAILLRCSIQADIFSYLFGLLRTFCTSMVGQRCIIWVHPCLDYTLMDYTLMDYLWMDYKDSWTTPNWTTYDVWTTAVWTTNHLDYPPIGLPMTFGLPPFGLHPK